MWHLCKNNVSERIHMLYARKGVHLPPELKRNALPTPNRAYVTAFWYCPVCGFWPAVNRLAVDQADTAQADIKVNIT